MALIASIKNCLNIDIMSWALAHRFPGKDGNMMRQSRTFLNY
jgi:hypothetical protein